MESLLEFLVKGKVNNSISNEEDEMNETFKRLLDNNNSIIDDFKILLKNTFIDCKYPIFNNQQELFEQWPTLDDAIEENVLYDELDETTVKNEFAYNTFYKVVDTIKGNARAGIDELAYVYLKYILK